MKLRFIVLLAFALATAPCDLRAQRSIPDDNLGYPVLISLSDCNNNITAATGSGFYLDSGSGEYLVTARHVLFNASEIVQPNQPRSLLCKRAELISYSRDPKERRQNRIQLDLQALNAAGRVKSHVTRDVAVVQIGTSNKGVLNLMPGAVAISIAATGIVDANLASVKKFDEVLTGNDVYVLAGCGKMDSAT